MPQKEKIFDIIPPKETAVKIEIKRSKPVEKKPASPKVSVKKIPLLVTAGIIFVLFLSWLLIEPKADIKIWPQKDLLELQIQATVYEQGSAAAGDVPGTFLEAERIVSGKFTVTGSKLKTARASGIITVYNAYSTSVRSFVANTRFMSDNGQLFRSPEKVTIPGAYYEGGKLMPGKAEIRVVADQPGEEYNIGPSTFSLPGLVGTALYTSIYGKSFGAIEGGIKEEVAQVTQDDIKRAELELTQAALEEAKTALEKILPSEDYIILKDAIEQKTVEYSPLAETGQEKNDFTAQLTSQARTMAFKEEAVKEFVVNYLVPRVPEGWVLQSDSLQMRYTVKEMDLAKNRIVLGLAITAAIYQTVDEENLKEMLIGKNPQAITRILNDYSQIIRARVDLWPFWTEDSPKNPKRINIEVILD